MVTAVGISNLQFVNLNSSRNLFVIGFATLMGLVVPSWIKKNPTVIDTSTYHYASCQRKSRNFNENQPMHQKRNFL